MGIVRIVHRHDMRHPFARHIVVVIRQDPRAFRRLDLKRRMSDECNPKVIFW